MTNDNPKDTHRVLQEAFSEVLAKASKEKVHVLCLGDLTKPDENGNHEGDLLISGNYGKGITDRAPVQLLLWALYGIFENSTPEEKGDFLTDLLDLYLRLATDGNEAAMEKIGDLLTDILYKAAGAVEVNLSPHAQKKN